MDVDRDGGLRGSLVPIVAPFLYSSGKFLVCHSSSIVVESVGLDDRFVLVFSPSGDLSLATVHEQVEISTRARDRRRPTFLNSQVCVPVLNCAIVPNS